MMTMPKYYEIRSGNCAMYGFKDILDDKMCRMAMNAGYYSTRDQNNNGILDSNEDYPNVFSADDATPPGCWPVDPLVLSVNPNFPNPFPFACVNTNLDSPAECSDIFPCFCEIPDYTIVREGNCESAGYYDIVTDPLCRAVMNDGYYNTRDQDQNGVIDADQMYENAIVANDNTPPGCWPVDPLILEVNPSFPNPFPFACINTNVSATAECSDVFPCFCLTSMPMRRRRH